VKSKINKNRCKNLTHLQVFTGQLRCLDVLTLDQLFKPINYSDFCYNVDKSRVMVVVFTATSNNNISVISWRLVLLVKETGVPKENHRPVASDWQTLSHNVILSTPRLSAIRTKTKSVVIGTDCIGSCKSNYHTINTYMWYCMTSCYKSFITRVSGLNG
jgi:hypothetical protein